MLGLFSFLLSVFFLPWWYVGLRFSWIGWLSSACAGIMVWKRWFDWLDVSLVEEYPADVSHRAVLIAFLPCRSALVVVDWRWYFGLHFFVYSVSAQSITWNRGVGSSLLLVFLSFCLCSFLIALQSPAFYRVAHFLVHSGECEWAGVRFIVVILFCCCLNP